MASNTFTDYFQVGLTFYGTAWDKNIPFEICLLPSLEKNSLNARAFINVAICEASLGLKDYKILFSVAMHEIFHIIYDNQSVAMKEDLQKWFDDTKSGNSQYALLLLNEVLATALGNAYVTEQLKGKIEEEDWYNNKYIAAMAKEIYPLVKTYILEKKPIDESFINAYVKSYDTKFPGWATELNHIMAHRFIVTDKAEDFQFFRKKYRNYSYSRMGAPITATEIEKVKALPITKVIIISENNRQALNLLEFNFEELKAKKLNYKKEFIEIVNLKDHTKLFIINRHTSTVNELMNGYFPDNIIK